MKKSPVFISLAVLSVLLTACNTNRPFTHQEFDSITADHKTVAVLPFEMVFNGRLPKDWTEADKQKVEEAESLIFQRSLVNQLLRTGRASKKPFKVDFQSPEKTVSLLKEHHLSVRESWEEDPQKLAQLLGVDAVIKGKVAKTRFLSNLESVGVALAEQIILQNGQFGVVPNLAKTHDVQTFVSLIDGEDGKILFNQSCKFSVDYSSNVNHVVDRTNYRIAKQFPYREEGS